jgi:hypothetical protein
MKVRGHSVLTCEISATFTGVQNEETWNTGIRNDGAKER